MIIKETDKEYELIPEGTHVGRQYMACDLGDHLETYNEQETVRKKFRWGWEFPLLLMGEGDHKGQPFSISKRYTASLHSGSKLSEHLTSWRGKAPTDKEKEKGFDTSSMLGVPALITVIHVTSKINGRVYPVVSAITGLPKGLKCPKAVNKPISFSLDDPDYLEKYKELPEWLQQKINYDEVSIVITMPEDPDQIGGDPEFDDTIEDVPF